MSGNTKRRQYATLAVLELARAYKSKKPISAQKIASKYSFSTLFLTQIFQRLRKAGVVETVRGPLGGYRLIPAPNELTVGFIVSLFERQNQDSAPIPTNVDKNAQQTLVQISKIWNQAEVRYQEYLNNVLYSDLIAVNDTDAPPLDFSI